MPESIDNILLDLTKKAQDLLNPARLAEFANFEGSKGLAGYICSWVPQEILRAGNYLPVLLRELEKTDRSNNSDSCCQCCKGVCSFFGHLPSDVKLGLVAIPNTCTTLEKSVAELSRRNDVELFFIDEPKIQSDEGLRSYVHHLYWLKDTVSVGVQAEEFSANLARYHEEYSQMRESLERIRRSEKLPASLYFNIHATTQTASINSAKEFLSEIESKLESLPPVKGRRMLLIGGFLGANELELTRILESEGIFICADLLCTSGRDFGEAPDTTGMDVFEKIAIEYFNRLPCLPILPNNRFYDRLNNILEEKNIEGIVFIKPENCDLYDSELERMLLTSSVPVLPLPNKLAQNPTEAIEAIRTFTT